jgi:hypothetical protein
VEQQTLHARILQSLVGSFNKLASILWRIALQVWKIGIRLLCIGYYHVPLPQ